MAPQASDRYTSAPRYEVYYNSHDRKLYKFKLIFANASKRYEEMLGAQRVWGLITQYGG